MTIRSRLHRALAWLAFVSMFFASFAPTVSHALAISNGQVVPWSDVCTTTGARIQFDNAGTGSDSSPAKSHATKCSFCHLYSALFLPDTAAAFHLELAAQGSPYAIPFLEVLPEQCQWQPAQSRAPPVVFNI
jgi:Protein of unknown function (DUF2946)